MRALLISLTRKRCEVSVAKSKGSRRQVGFGSGIFPRCPAATCGSRDKVPMTRTTDDTPRSSVGRQIVSTKTYAASLVGPNPPLPSSPFKGTPHPAPSYLQIVELAAWRSYVLSVTLRLFPALGFSPLQLDLRMLLPSVGC